MADREQYAPGSAIGAQPPQDEESWTIILTREPSHSPETIWRALTDPSELCQWAAFDADAILGSIGAGRSATLDDPPPRSAAASIYG